MDSIQTIQSSASIGTSPLGFRLNTDTSTTPDETNSDATLVSSPITSPPYWVQSHQRSVSSASVESVDNGAITLRDNTSPDGQDGKNRACWARSVEIDDFVVVNGNRTGIGSFVVWNITVKTLRGGIIRIRKRYSEFDDLRDRLLQTFPNSEGAMPPLPPKSVISKFRPKFLENRRSGLQYFLKCVLSSLGCCTLAYWHSCIILNPEFSSSPVLKEFLFE